MKPCPLACRSSGAARAPFALLLLLLFLASPASAYTITQIGVGGGNPIGQPRYEVSGLVQGDTFLVSWALDGSGLYGGDLPDLSALASITVTSLSTTTLVLDIALENTTAPLSGPPDLTAAIAVFGLGVTGVDPGNPGNSLSSTGSYLDLFAEGGLSGLITLDVCAGTSVRCDRGIASEGIQIGGSDAFQFTLQGTFDPESLTLNHFGTKWYTNYDEIVPGVDGNRNFSLLGAPTAAGDPIPEPSTGALLALGIVALGMARRPRV